MNEQYKFIIIKGRKGLYNAELKTLKAKYGENSLPHPVKGGKGIIMWSPSKELVKELEGFDIVTTKIEEYQDSQIKPINNQLIEIENEQYSKFYHINENGRLIFHRTDIAKYLTEKYHARVIPNKEYMYVYNFNKKYYEINYGDIFKTKINMMFGDMVDKGEVDQIMAKIWSYEPRHVSENTLWINNQYINFENGVFDIETMKLYNHDPTKYFFQSIIPHEYDYNAESPNILGLLKRIFMTEENIQSQLEWIGFCLTPGYKYKMINFYVGMSDSGKTTYFNLIENMVGTDNKSAIAPQDMKGDYNLAELRGKMVNIAADIGNDKIRHFNILRELSGNDKKAAREIYRSPFTFVNEAKLMFGCNEIPEFDNVQATYNRVKIIICKNVFNKTDIAKFNMDIYTTEEEISGLINEGIKAYKNTLLRGGFIKDDSDETARIHDLMTNRLWVWSNDNLDWCEDDKIMWMDELRLDYYNWCKRNDLVIDLEPKAFAIKFKKEFKDYYYTKEKMRGSRGNQKRAILGVRRKNSKSINKYNLNM